MSLIKLQEKIGVVADNQFGPKTFNAAIKYYNLTKLRGAHFFGQVGHETGEFKWFSENLNYSASNLVKVFKKYFPTYTIANEYAYKPEKIANRVYANRMGNGSESSGDGWKYRGRGALQLTGKYNYEQFAKYVNDNNIIYMPGLVATKYSFESAMFYFDNNRLWNICDRGLSYYTIKDLTRKINGGYNGLDHRVTLTQKYFMYY